MATEFQSVVRIRGMEEIVTFRTSYTLVPDVHDFIIKTAFVCKDDIPNGTVLTCGGRYDFAVFTEMPSFQKKLFYMPMSRTKEWRLAVQEIFKTPVEDINTVKSLLEFM